MAVKLMHKNLVSSLITIALLCDLSISQASDIKKGNTAALPIVLTEKGLLESQYWRPVNATLTPPVRPKLAAEKLGFLVNFCLSVDFTIKSDGNIANIKIKKTKPAGVITEVTVADLQNMLHWQFEPTAENTRRQPVISNRVFNFKVNHRAPLADCFTN